MVTIKGIFELIRIIFQCAGVAAITIGGLYALIRFVGEHLRKIKGYSSFERLRFTLSQSLIIGLELIVAADVINTVRDQDYWQLGMLVILVIVRTVLNYFLKQDLKDISARDRKAFEAF